GNVKLVILSEDAAANVTKNIKNKCATYHVTLLTFATRFELGYAIGKESRVVLGITDIGFSKKLKTMIHDFHEERSEERRVGKECRGGCGRGEERRIVGRTEMTVEDRE